MAKLHYLIILFVLVFSETQSVLAQQAYEEKKDIPYYTDLSDAYIAEQCKLDIYIPKGKKDFTTIVWYHGGGLTGGRKEIPEYLKNKGYAIIGVGYRFAPKVKVKDIIEDAAQSVKWVFDHIAEYGGSTQKIVLTGHSAGGYLSAMLSLNKSYLEKHQIDSDQLLGIVPFSPQAITHYTARKENGIEINQPVIDEFAPLYWVRKGTAPITLITGDRELEMVGRYDENAYLQRMFKIVGNEHTKLIELEGYGHDMTYPAFPILVREIERWEKGEK